jgi:hypothetical protein
VLKALSNDPIEAEQAEHNIRSVQAAMTDRPVNSAAHWQEATT